MFWVTRLTGTSHSDDQRPLVASVDHRCVTGAQTHWEEQNHQQKNVPELEGLFGAVFSVCHSRSITSTAFVACNAAVMQ